MLEAIENLCLAKLIGLANALNLDCSYDMVNQDVMACLNDLKRKQDVKPWLSRLDEDKAMVVPNCQLCASPCGRTQEVSINDLANHKEKIMAYRNLLNRLDECSMIEIYTQLCELSF